MSQIVTFYSFKGGVGRTMALANIACSLAAKGRRVLVVDWDLEAPGLHRYFVSYEKHQAMKPGGTLALLEIMAVAGAADSTAFEEVISIPKTDFFSGCNVRLLPAGIGSADYEQRALDFKLEDFYRDKNGAHKLEELRQSWRQRFDFVLIDSRTGITDTGGVCTIFLPDILVLVFTANEQSLAGAIDVAHRAQKGRQCLSFDRKGLTVFPLPSRFDSRTEYEESDQWMRRFADDLAPFFSTWCPRDIPPRTLVERIKIPHVPYFSFGEKLPIVTHPETDPDLPGFYYQNVAAMLDSEFAESVIRSACGISSDFKSDISRIVRYAPAELIGREEELTLLNDAWNAVQRADSKRPQIITFVGLGGEGTTSLVSKWAAELAYQDWPGCDAAFAWSFYSQGTSDKSQTSSDSFLREALLFFGDAEMAESAAGSFDKGQRLAQLVGERRSLLILDGIEPLQYAPTSATGSELKDRGIAALLKGLAANNNGLCIITTRYSIPDLRNFWQTTAPEIKLRSLSTEAGVALLRRLGVKGSQKEFEQLVIDVKGHALTLNLLGSFLRDAHAGDIRKRDLVKLEEADAEEQSGYAFHVMDAYVKSFKVEGEKGLRALMILRLLGLFDRPATWDCLNALWTGEEISGLNGSLIGISESQRNITLKRLEDAGFITMNRDESQYLSVDAHPLLREYFASRVRKELPGAWHEAHRRLYEHLIHGTREGDEPTLEDLQPLYQAVAHGSQSALLREACRVYSERILRGDEYYSLRQLGAVASDLGAITCFFDTPWTQVSSAFAPHERAWLFNEAAFRLRALGRLVEALEPMRAGLADFIGQQNWRDAAVTGGNLSELELALGRVSDALQDAAQSTTYADRSNDEFLMAKLRTTHAEVLTQAGNRVEAETRFREAEHLHAERKPGYPLMFSLQGFRYCDFLLADPEAAAWRSVLLLKTRNSNRAAALSSCNEVSARAEQTLKWAQDNLDLLTIALDQLTFGRAALYLAIVEKSMIVELSTVQFAVDGLRRAGTQDHLPRGLLTRAWLRCFGNNFKSAQEDLDEAWEIAERGPMRLHMADIHLYRARLFHAVKPYPWNKFDDGREGRGPKDDLADARKLIEKCGYWRRKEELEDAEEAAKGWS